MHLPFLVTLVIPFSRWQCYNNNNKKKQKHMYMWPSMIPGGEGLAGNLVVKEFGWDRGTQEEDLGYCQPGCPLLTWAVSVNTKLNTCGSTVLLGHTTGHPAGGGLCTKKQKHRAGDGQDWGWAGYTSLHHLNGRMDPAEPRSTSFHLKCPELKGEDVTSIYLKGVSWGLNGLTHRKHFEPCWAHSKFS